MGPVRSKTTHFVVPRFLKAEKYLFFRGIGIAWKLRPARGLFGQKPGSRVFSGMFSFGGPQKLFDLIKLEGPVSGAK
jgi:hypothetical protein